MQEYIKTNIRESMEAKRQLLEDTSLIESIEQIAALCIAAYQNGNKILVCGNGGSASDAQQVSLSADIRWSVVGFRQLHLLRTLR